MTDFSAVRRAADATKDATRADPNQIAGKGGVLRTGVIVSYSSGRAVVNVGGDDTDIPDVATVPPWDGVDYAAGDNVLLLQDPPKLVVLCKLA